MAAVPLRQYFENSFKDLFKRLDAIEREMQASRAGSTAVLVQVARLESELAAAKQDIREMEDYARRLLYGLISIGVAVLGYLLVFLINTLT